MALLDEGLALLAQKVLVDDLSEIGVAVDGESIDAHRSAHPHAVVALEHSLRDEGSLGTPASTEGLEDTAFLDQVAGENSEPALDLADDVISEISPVPVILATRHERRLGGWRSCLYLGDFWSNYLRLFLDDLSCNGVV